MGGKLNDYKMVLIITLSSLLLASATIAESEGITGDKAEGDSDVAKTGCTCHSNNQIAPSDSVTLILDGAPFMWSEGTSYPLTIQIFGGPEITSGSNTGGFSMLVSAGTLEAGERRRSGRRGGRGPTTGRRRCGRRPWHYFGSRRSGRCRHPGHHAGPRQWLHRGHWP